MASPKTKGRMLNKDISDSKKFAALSPAAAVLFCMMVPHYSAHGKMNGDPGYIKGEICPRVPYLTIGNIPKYLKEISDKTSVKWFEHDERWWIHSTKFLSDHQKLDPEKLGRDLLPSYSGVGPELGSPEVEVEVEEEVEVKGEGDSATSPPAGGPVPSPEDLFQAWNTETKVLPKARALSETRRKHCRMRLKERPLSEWGEIFRQMEQIPFLRGDNDRGWVATFDWIIRSPDNALKVLEGKYINRREVEEAERSKRSAEWLGS